MKTIVIIPMAIFELLFLGFCWLVAFTHKPTAKKLVRWSLDNLPSKEWYYT